MNFDIDIAIVVAFLAATLFVGVFYGRGVSNIKDYALGGRNFSTAALTATIIATWIGGNSLGIATFDAREMGVFFIIPGFSDVISFLLLAYVIIPRMFGFLGSMSIAESMGKLYGNKIRFISSISGIVPTIGSIAIQFIIFSSMMSYFFEISSFVALLITSSIVIIYSAFGGIRSITLTDVIQFLAFGIAIPMVAFIIWQSFYSIEPIQKTLLNNPIFDYTQLFDFKSSTFSNNIVVCLFFIIPAIDPTIFQRISMARSVNQAKKAFISSGLIIFFCQYLVLYLIGLLLLSGGITDLNPDNIIEYISYNYLTTGFKGIFFIGIMAMAMSTADSYINSSSVLLSHDLLKSIGVKFNQKQELIAARLSAIFIGVSALILSMYSTSLLDLILTTYSFYMPIVSVPLLLSIFGFRTTSNNVLLGMLVGFITVISCQLFYEMDGLIPGMIAHIIFLLPYHYITKSKGGWIGNKDNTELHKIINTRRERRSRVINFFASLPSQILNFQSYVNYFNSKRPKLDIMYIYFAISVLFSVLSIFYIDKPLYHQNHYLINTILVITLSTATFFFCSTLYSKKLKEKYVGFIWFFSILVNFILIGSFLVMVNNFAYIPLTIFTIQLTIIPLLLGWRTSFIIIPIGFFVSFFLYQSYIGEMTPSGVEDLKLKLSYTLFMIAIFSLTIIKSAQEYLEATEAKVDTLESEVTTLDHKNVDLSGQVVKLNTKVTGLNTKVTDLNDTVSQFSTRVADQEKEIERLGATAQKILNNVNHELRLPVGNVMNFAEMLHDGLGKFNEDQLKMISDEVFKNSNRLSSMIMNMLDLATLEAKKLELKKKTINLGELVEDRVKYCRKVYLEGKKIDFRLEIQPNVLIDLDPDYMRQVVDNLVINAIKFSKEGTINITLLKPRKFVEFTISDSGIGIPKNDLYDIFTPFKMGSNTESKAEGRGVGLALCKAAIEAHGGTISADSIGGKGAIFKFLL